MPAAESWSTASANAPSIEEDLKAAESVSPLNLRALRGGPGAGASDDATFLLRKIPAHQLFLGLPFRLSPAERHVGEDRRPRRRGRRRPRACAGPAIVEPQQRAQSSSKRCRSRIRIASGNVGAVSGYGPYFGSVPDFANEGQGVKFAEVRTGSPAAKAGFRGGDVMISFGGMPIKTLYDFTFALREKKPGDRVEVIVLRDGKEVKATVELTNRPMKWT